MCFPLWSYFWRFNIFKQEIWLGLADSCMFLACAMIYLVPQKKQPPMWNPSWHDHLREINSQKLQGWISSEFNIKKKRHYILLDSIIFKRKSQPYFSNYPYQLAKQHGIKYKWKHLGHWASDGWERICCLAGVATFWGRAIPQY